MKDMLLIFSHNITCNLSARRNMCAGKPINGAYHSDMRTNKSEGQRDFTCRSKIAFTRRARCLEGFIVSHIRDQIDFKVNIRLSL